MKRRVAICASLLCAFSLTASFAWAASQVQERDRVQVQKKQQIYGSQMMTATERNEYRNRIQAAKTNQEREQIRMEHHELMKKRTGEQGLRRPNAPPVRRGGMGPHHGIRSAEGKGKNR